MKEENERLNSNNDNDNLVIIKTKNETYSLEKDKYNEELLGDIITKNTFNEIIDSATRVMGQSWIKKRANDQITIPKTVIVLSVIAILLTITYIITLYLSTTVEDGTALFIVSIICISISTIIVFSLSFYNFFRKIGKFQSLNTIIKEDLDSLFGNLNSQYSGKLNFFYNDDEKQLEIKVLMKPKNRNQNIEMQLY